MSHEAELRGGSCVRLAAPPGGGSGQWEPSRGLAGRKGRSSLFSFPVPVHSPLDFLKQRSGRILPCSKHSVAPCHPLDGSQIPPRGPTTAVFEGLLLLAAHSMYFPNSPRSLVSAHLPLPAARFPPGGQPQRISLSSRGCCAPALTGPAAS